MRKILSLIIFTLYLFFPLLTFAHPVDTSTMLLYIGKDVSGNEIPQNRVEGVITFNWLQLSALTGENKSPIEIYTSIGSYDEKLYQYLNSNIQVSNNDKTCKTSLKRFVELDVNVVLNLGVRYQLESVCDENIQNFKVTNTSFKDQVITQSNRILLHKDTEKVSENPNGDLKYPESTTNTNSTNNSQKSNLIESFTNLLKQDDGWSVPIIFGLVYLIGMLHSLEGGHNKIILGSLVLDKKIDLKQSILFTIIFTLTHMSDIILLSIGLIFLQKFINLYTLVPNLSLYTLLILLVISGYSVFKEIRHILEHKLNIHHHHEHEHNHDHGHEHSHEEIKMKNDSVWKMITIAFISGLAPCITGWSVFMLFFSTGRVSLVLPSMIFFGLGVFTVLIIYTLLLHKAKNIFSDRLNWISQYSTLISMTLIFITTIIQIVIALR